MLNQSESRVFTITVVLAFMITACNSNKPAEREIVATPEDINVSVSKNIRKSVSYFNDNEGKLDDSITIKAPELVSSFYEQSDYKGAWSSEEHWKPAADSMFAFIKNSRSYGLFPEDYHYSVLNNIKERFINDSTDRLDAALWTRADVMLSDAFLKIARDLYVGRIAWDSTALREDTLIENEFYVDKLKTLFDSGSLTNEMENLEPKLKVYTDLKSALKLFLAKADFTPRTYIEYPFTDSMTFIHSLLKRLNEEDSIVRDPSVTYNDSMLKAVLTQYQELNNLTVDGKYGPQTIRSLNDFDAEKFMRIAINLDRYKLLPKELPEQYVWVNIPSFTLKVMSHDTVEFESRVIVGNPKTRTPLLYSEISNIITYPVWTVPYSIIFKEMLPKIQKDPGYLEKENLVVVNYKDSILDPYLIDWSKLSKKRFPYLIKQREGVDNSLGVIKFNFRNKYSVYLHDTNARYLFKSSNRALSHGCVRVQQWEKLANYLIDQDTTRVKPDSVFAWINRGEKHQVNLPHRLPLFIRYNTCEVDDGTIKFFDDIYNEDMYLREKYFANKN